MTLLNRRHITILILLLSTSAKAQLTNSTKLFTALPSSTTGVQFRNDIVEDEKMFYYMFEYLYNGCGVSVGDFNKDGLPDLYFNSTMGTNKLYLNEGNFHFKDITLTAGVSGGAGIKTGVNVFDINNDGYPDILICKSGPGPAALRKKILYINNHDLTFTDRAKEYGLDDDSHSSQGYFLDYDKDGDMDLFFVNQLSDFNSSMAIQAKMVNGKMVYIEDSATVGVSNRLYENRNRKFVDVTAKAGLISHNFGLSASVFDFNNDGWPDIYVANDFNKPDNVYINDHNGHFTDKLGSYFSHIPFFSMGTDINDINNDGLEDLISLDMSSEDPVRQKQLFSLNVNYDRFHLLTRFNLFYQYPHNCLQLNNGNGTFSEMAFHSGVAQTDWSWAPLIADYDNDGWKDMYITNGLLRDITDWDYKEFVLDSVKNLMSKGQAVSLSEWFKQIPSSKIKNYFFHNNGSLQFDNYSSTWTDAPASFSNGAAYVDLDNDGDLDLVVNNVQDEAFILKNNSNENPEHHFLRLRFFKNKNSAEEVYGTRVTLTNNEGKLQTQHYDPQRGYLSTMEHVLHFGLGADKEVTKAEIQFPSGKKIILNHVPADQVLDLYESNAQTDPVKKETAPALFTDISNQNGFRYTHVENEYIDFKREPLLPYQYSRKGPYYAMGDVNGDKRADIYIGGAAGIAGKIMLQQADGKFTESNQAAFIKDKAQEDNGAVFFDADGDGDLDLYVVSGGGEFEAGSNLYQDRLYLNDGRGNFTRSPNALPKESFNGSCVIALDFDGDGDMDLFVGGGTTPGRFPQHDNCILLQNNKGQFTDLTETVAPNLNKQVGIVNAASWADINGNKEPRLILAGEWMPISLFAMQEGKLIKQNANVTVQTPLAPRTDTLVKLDALTGWWNTVVAEDIDHDGDLDLIVGNRGTNSRISCDINQPCTIYAKDFDNNGSYDAVLGYYNRGKCYPMYSRDQLIDQMSFFRKRYYRYHQYAGQTLDELFSPEQKKGMDIFTTGCFESGVLINNGDGSYHFIAFPERAQLSTINDMVVDDIDGDGIKDIVVCGNSYDADVATGNYDATAALFLKGDGKGHFTARLPGFAGLNIRGEARKLVYLKSNAGRSLIFLKNSAAAQVFSLKK